MESIKFGPVPLRIVDGQRGGEFRVEGKTSDSIADEQPLRFDPPISPEGDPVVAQNSWRRLQFAFDMRDPSEFPHGTNLNDAERTVLERFRQVANELGDSAIINERWNFQATIRPGQEDEVGGHLPSNIQMAGFATYLRQCDSDAENASFSKVHKMLGKGLSEHDPEVLERGNAILKSWRKARREMRDYFVDQMIIKRLEIAGQVPRGSAREYPWTPADLAKAFHYGELIHWGKQREQLANVQTVSPALRRFAEFKFIESAEYFGHFYVGVASLIDHALGES